jgi:hypothetical protein
MLQLIRTDSSELSKFISMDCFAEKTKELAHKADILLLPDINVREGIERAFQPDTLSFYKYAKQNSKDLEVELFENEGEIRTLALHSFDIWLPTIWIGCTVLLPFVINLTSSYVFEKLKGREKEEVTVQLRVEIENREKGKSASILYKGSEQGLRESFKKININKLWEE